VTQAFLFDGAGGSFWPAYAPISPEELVLLEEAIELTIELEQELKKPFIGHDPNRRFSITAMSEESNLYLVCLNLDPKREAAEVALVDMRAALVPHLGVFSKPHLTVVG